MKNRQIVGVKLHEFGFVFDIYKYRSLAVGHGKFGFAPERQGSGDRTACGVDRGGVLAAAIHSEDTLCCRVVNNGVRIRPGFYGANVLQGFKIEDGDGVGATVARESATCVRSDRDAMNSLCIGDVTDYGVGVSVEDYHVRTMGNIDAATRTVDEEIVPTLVARDGNSLRNA